MRRYAGRAPRLYLTRHHLKPKVHFHYERKPVDNSDANLLRLWNNKHIAWHQLFKEMSLDQIIEALERVRRMKNGKESRVQPLQRKVS